MNDLIWLLIALISVYTIIPTLVIRLFGVGVYKRGIRRRGIALTFDDGPDPEYTPRLLDLLKQYNIKATFFVLGSKAKKHPDLIKRMHQEGHLVGVHNYVHWANAVMTPWKVRLQVNQSVKVIESIIGQRPVYYRPPWGVINLFDFLLLKHFQMVMWSIIVGDWKSKVGKNKIKQRLLSKLKDGAVIVLHDSGQTLGADRNAPTYMLEALADFITETLIRSYSFVRIDEGNKLDEPNLRWHKHVLISFWLRWEQIFRFMYGLKQVDSDHDLFFLRVRAYHGETFLLSDDEELRDGDRVVELHLNNETLLRMASRSKSMVQLAVLMIRAVRQILPKINEKILVDPHYSNVKCIYGITMIHRGTNQLGFTAMEIPRGAFAFLAKYYLRMLLYVIHPQGKQRLKIKTDLLTPKIIAMSVKELQKRYTTNMICEEPLILQSSLSARPHTTLEDDIPQSV